MARLRVSGNKVSRQAGLGVSYVNDLLSGSSNQPSRDKLEQIAAALKCDPAYLLGEQDTPRASEAVGGLSGINVLTLPHHGGGRRISTDAVRLPLFSAPWPDEHGYFPMVDTAEETTPLPIEPTGGAYAVLVPDNRMAPRFFIGEKVFANPRRPIQAGVFVIVRLTDGRAAIRRVVGIDSSSVELEEIASRERAVLRRDEIGTIHRIVASSEA